MPRVAALPIRQPGAPRTGHCALPGLPDDGRPCGRHVQEGRGAHAARVGHPVTPSYRRAGAVTVYAHVVEMDESQTEMNQWSQPESPGADHLLSSVNDHVLARRPERSRDSG